jgi:tetratricopeptide (TPR) repeat protein
LRTRTSPDCLVPPAVPIPEEARYAPLLAVLELLAADAYRCDTGHGNRNSNRDGTGGAAEEAWPRLPTLVPHVIAVARHYPDDVRCTGDHGHGGRAEPSALHSPRPDLPDAGSGVPGRAPGPPSTGRCQDVVRGHVARLLHLAGRHLQAEGQDAVTRPLLERAVRLTRAVGPDDDPMVAVRVCALTTTLHALGELEEAERLLEELRAIHDRGDEAAHAVTDDGAPVLAGLLTNLAAVRQAQGRPDAARQLLERALVLNQRVLGPDHPDVAVALNNLGLALRDLGEPKEARSQLERALTIDEAEYGREHPHVAADLSHLALVLGDLEDWQGARERLERAVRIDEIVHGNDHPRVAEELLHLVRVLLRLEDLPAVKRHAHRAREILETAHGSDHPAVIELRDHLDGLTRRRPTGTPPPPGADEPDAKPR